MADRLRRPTMNDVARVAGVSLKSVSRVINDEVGASPDTRERVLAVEPDHWAALRADPDAVVVEDAGLTQVAPGTETVLALPPHSQARIRGVVLP